jgi:succinate dehydrogenase/fumarate reductase flavoprotein subunit
VNLIGEKKLLKTIYGEDELQLTTQVLVIGGGPAAAWAAWAAASQGVEVIIVDKGFLGTSGAAAASGNGIMAPSPENWEKVLWDRYQSGKNLANLRWIERVIEKTWLSLPLVEDWGYRFPKENGESVRQSYYGPEYMRVMRKNLLRVGVQILDQSPALELLLAEDGSVAGARGVQRQNHRTYTVRAGAVVLANGGCAFLSKALGCNTNTGDGLLMAVEAGAELSSMEASNHYAISTGFNATVTRGVPFIWATYTDEAGNNLGSGYINGRRDPSFLPKALLKGPVYARLDRATEEVKSVIEKSHFIAFLPYKKAGIDPYTERVPVTMVLEGTVRGTGGIRIVDDSCGTKVPGLYAAGDAASRELLAGLASGGGGPNAAWAISTGQWAGVGAAVFAKSLGTHVHQRVVHPTGQVGLQSHSSGERFDSEAIVRDVQAEVFPLEKNYLRSEQGLVNSLTALESLWKQVQSNPKQDTVRDVEFSRRAASLTAVARWSYFSALNRRETRSGHIRVDYPQTDPDQRYYQATGGLEKLWVRRDWIKDDIAIPPVLTTQAAA